MVSTPYETLGRTSQKRRTRQALVDAARELVARGMTPTVEDAAETAGISRATAYRYFPNQGALLAAAHPEIETQSLLPPDAPDDPVDRLAMAIREFTTLVVNSEPQQRTMLRLSLDPNRAEPLLLRQGRAIPWIEEALEPCRDVLSDRERRRLALAIRSAVGIESLVWLVDVAELSRDEAVELQRWTASALLQTALADAGGSRPG
jgi:AcrR family transcriptional regulator